MQFHYLVIGIPKIEEPKNKLNNFWELPSENDIELHVKEFDKRGTRKKLGEYQNLKLSDLNTDKNTTIDYLKRVKYKDLEYMLYRLQLNYDEIIDTLDVKYIAGSTCGYTLPPGVYEISNINWMLRCLLLDKVKINFKIDDIRLKSNLTTNKTIRFTKKKYFFFTNLAFTESYSGVLCVFLCFVQLIPGSYKCNKLNNFTGIHEIQLK